MLLDKLFGFLHRSRVCTPTQDASPCSTNLFLWSQGPCVPHKGCGRPHESGMVPEAVTVGDNAIAAATLMTSRGGTVQSR